MQVRSGHRPVAIDGHCKTHRWACPGLHDPAGTDNQVADAVPDHRQLVPIALAVRLAGLDRTYSGTSPKANWAAPLVIAW
jgi:hypothetical protein